MPETADKLPKADLIKGIEEDIAEVVHTTPLENAKTAMQMTLREDDTDRINAATNLLNTWNFAVQVQGNRAKWTPNDYKAFAIALVAIDSVGKGAREVKEQLDPYQSHVPVNQA